jgi:hypothetical protein
MGSAATQKPLAIARAFAENAQPNDPKRIRSEAQSPHTVFETERYSNSSYILLNHCCPIKNKGIVFKYLKYI